MRHGIVLFALLFGSAVACGPDRRGETCEPSCQRRICGDDGCGGTCGTCSTGSCEAGLCVGGCTPTTCAASGKNCGAIPDGCNGTLECGTCEEGACGGGGTPNVCGSGSCTPESDEAFCARLQKNCDEVTAVDNCGVSRTAACGTCATGTCGGGGTANVCGAPSCASPDCRTWTVAVTPTSASSEINWMWGRSDTTILTVGAAGTMQRWNGEAWFPAASTTNPPTRNALWSAWGTGTAVFVVGEGGVILRGTDSSGTYSWTPLTPGTSQDLYSVWGFGVNDVWAVGDLGVMLHSTDGTTWTNAGTVGGSTTIGVWGAGANDAWAVGSAGRAVHWNGQAWSSAKDGLGSIDLNAVWGSGGEVWTAGWSNILFRRGTSEAAWTPFPTGIPEAGFTAIWGNNANDVYAAGFIEGAVGATGLLMHWDGSAWSRVTLPSYTATVTTVWGTPSEVWAADDDGRIFRGR